MVGSYETVIGLEVHVELATKSKIFCGCATDFGAQPNTQVCPVCTGMPGALPVLNRKVVEYAAAVGLAVNCRINRISRFDRKNYFYPDNPQNYQITQRYLPICQDGWLEIETQAGAKRIGILEIHMEEDAGKLFHQPESGLSMIDYNRSGVPLLEIVTDPDMGNAEEVLAFLEQLRLRIQYLGASDCKLQEGSMRVDVNLSVRKPGENTLGTRTEMKNLNSFRAICRAIAHESSRQIELLERGGKVEQETRRWDEEQGRSYSMRSKEDARDYRYFPEPDLPPVFIEEKWLGEILREQPEFREAKRKRYVKEFGLPEYDADILTSSKKLADLFEETAALCLKPKKVSNWLMGETLRLLKENRREPEELDFTPAHLAKLIDLTDQGKISNQVAKEVFARIFSQDVDPELYIKEKGLESVTDVCAIREAAGQVLREYPALEEEYRGGKEKVLGFLMGQTMKKLAGKADPGTVSRIMRELLQRTR